MAALDAPGPAGPRTRSSTSPPRTWTPWPPSSPRPAIAARWWCRCCSPSPSTPPSTCPQAVRAAAESAGHRARGGRHPRHRRRRRRPAARRPGRRRGGLGSSVLLYAVGSSNPAANAAVAELAARLGRPPGGRRPGAGGLRHLPRRGRPTCSTELPRAGRHPAAVPGRRPAARSARDPGRRAAAGPWSSRSGSGLPDRAAALPVPRRGRARADDRLWPMAISEAHAGRRYPPTAAVRGLRGQDRRVRPGAGRRQPGATPGSTRSPRRPSPR